MSEAELLTVAPAVASAAATVMLAVVTYVQLSDSYAWRHTLDARQAVDALYSHQMIQARNVVGDAARKRRLSKREREQFISAVFVLMWTIEAAQFQFRAIRKTRLVVREATVLYDHLGEVVKDLRAALLKYGWMLDWEDTGKRINKTLDEMPTVRRQWMIAAARPTKMRLPVGEAGGNRA